MPFAMTVEATRRDRTEATPEILSRRGAFGAAAEVGSVGNGVVGRNGA